MTPELSRACEIVFQEHKRSTIPVNWNKEAFLDRLTWGLREKAKETLLQKKVIGYTNKTKRTQTTLADAVRQAETFNEAITLAAAAKHTSVVSPAPVFETAIAEQVTATRQQYVYVKQTTAVAVSRETAPSKWYLGSFYYYIVWPACAAIAGAGIAYLLGNLASTI